METKVKAKLSITILVLMFGLVLFWGANAFQEPKVIKKLHIPPAGKGNTIADILVKELNPQVSEVVFSDLGDNLDLKTRLLDIQIEKQYFSVDGFISYNSETDIITEYLVFKDNSILYIIFKDNRLLLVKIERN